MNKINVPDEILLEVAAHSGIDVLVVRLICFVEYVGLKLLTGNALVQVPFLAELGRFKIA